MSESISYQQLLQQQLSIPTPLLLSYKQLGLHEVEVVIVLQIHHFIQNGNEFPTPQELCAYITLSENQLLDHLRSLIQRNIIEIKELRNEHNQLSEAYSLEPLWNRLYTPEEKPLKENDEGTIFVLFEQEFGRLLSPFEIETINAWLDEDNIIPALIKAALREAVLMGKLNFRYIDRILREWKHKGIHSVEQARESSKSFRKQSIQKQEKRDKKDTSIYFNWLKGD